MISAMKLNLTSISLTSLLVLLAAAAAGFAGASLPAALSAETVLAYFGTAGALSLFLFEYARTPRRLRLASERYAPLPRLMPAPEVFAHGGPLAVRRPSPVLT